jgi:hypothetical protein
MTSPTASDMTSTASVPTQRAARYGKQLSAHLGRRLETSWDESAGTGTVRFDAGDCTLTATPEALVLQATVHGDPADLQRVEDVVGRHLVRFGTRDELSVQWQRGDGTPGGTYGNDDDE